jgi:hypothetical protein
MMQYLPAKSNCLSIARSHTKYFVKMYHIHNMTSIQPNVSANADNWEVKDLKTSIQKSNPVEPHKTC